jgi:hypothetical protein
MIYSRHPSDPSLVIGDNGHVYATTRLPESGWNMREAWEILDALPPGAISVVARLFLAGLIAGALERIARERPRD